MTVSEFIRRLMQHLTLALGVWIISALTLERLVPGFVTPFINVPGIVLVFLVLSIIAISIQQYESSRVSRVVFVVLVAGLLLAAGFFLWSRIDSLGGLGLVLIGGTVCAFALTIVAFWSSGDQT